MTDILVPELGAPDEAEQTFKSNLADKANQNTKDISALDERVVVLEEAALEEEATPLFTIKEYGGVNTIKPFEGGQFRYCDILVVWDVDHISGESMSFLIESTDGSSRKIYFGENGNFGTTGNTPFVGNARVVEEALYSGSLTASTNTVGSTTATVRKWIVTRYN